MLTKPHMDLRNGSSSIRYLQLLRQIRLEILKLNDLIFLHNAEFLHQFHTGLLPNEFDDFFTLVRNRHSYNTRLASRSSYCLPEISTNYGQFNLRLASRQPFLLFFCIFAKSVHFWDDDEDCDAKTRNRNLILAMAIFSSGGMSRKRKSQRDTQIWCFATNSIHLITFRMYLRREPEKPNRSSRTVNGVASGTTRRSWKNTQFIKIWAKEHSKRKCSKVASLLG